MKLTRHALTRYWGLHAWVGVLAGLALHAMVLFGAVTLFHDPLSRWEEPLAQVRAPADLGAVVERALARAERLPDRFRVLLPEGDRGMPRVGFDPPGENTWRELWIHPETAALVPKRERLADLVFELHYLWHDQAGRWLYYVGGLLAVGLLVAIVTGVLIHLRNLARQFHQFRPHRTRRVVWSDMHKVLGVLGLPFQAMYAYTGAFMVLIPLVLPAFTGPVFGGDASRAIQVAHGLAPAPTKDPGARVPVLAADELIARARAAAPDLAPGSIVYRHHGRENAVVEVRGQVGTAPTTFGAVRLREVDGEVLAVRAPRVQGATSELRRWIFGLHFAHFGGLPVRILFFALALATCATILTGNWIWLERRRAGHGRPEERALARLTAGVGAGALVALAALFAASRLIPLDWVGRGAAEELVFAAALLACVGWAMVSRAPRSLWWQQLAIAGGLLVATPVLAVRVSGAAGIFGGAEVAEVAWVDAGLVVVGTALLAIARALRRAARRAPAAAEPPSARGEAR